MEKAFAVLQKLQQETIALNATFTTLVFCFLLRFLNKLATKIFRRKKYSGRAFQLITRSTVFCGSVKQPKFPISFCFDGTTRPPKASDSCCM